jgi:nucleotide-binding universal stress UspA family protein
MRVLVALDDDPLFEPVLANLQWCVRLSPSDLVFVVHVVPTFPWLDCAEPVPGWAEWVRDARQRGEKLLSRATARLAERKVRVEALVLEGHPAEEILKTGHRKEVDLIVLGALGRSMEERCRVGAVSQKVKALAERDVLLVREGQPEGKSFRALLAVDGSPESLAAVAAFAKKTWAERAIVHLVHVLDLGPLTPWDSPGEGTIDPARLPPVLRRHVERAVSQGLAILSENGLEATTDVCRGRAVEQILAVAGRFQPDLIVMGSRGLAGFRGVLPGSVTQRVVRHGSAAVLIAPAAAPRRGGYLV